MELGATLSLDYCFTTVEKAEDDTMAVLVAYDRAKSGPWALPVEHQKGYGMKES